jgi:hypothetical protein
MHSLRIVLCTSLVAASVAVASHTILAQQADITGFWRPMPRN